MREFLLNVLKALVDHPEQVILDQREETDKIIFMAQVARGDLGKIIGKQGRNAQAVRTLLKAVAAKEGKRAHFDIDE